MKEIFKKITRSENHLIILTILFFVVNGLWLLKMGVMVDADTKQYLQYAQELDEKGFFSLVSEKRF